MIRKLLVACFIALAPGVAWAQCSGQFTPGQVCGNSGSAQGVPTATGLSPLLDRNFGAPAAQGSLLSRGASVWSSTRTPVLGVPGTASGTLGLAGLTAGTVTLKATNSSSNWTFNLPPNAGTNTFVLTTDGSGNTTWTNNNAGGTVTSVALTAPAEFSVAGSPITTSGTFAVTKATQTANTVWAGPTSGGVAQPTFRALVGADLPNPSTSSLGGIQAINAVTSNWIRSINTSGVPQLSQPAFSDISGAITPAQCPNPSVSTIGCVESFAPQASKWINTISTSGVPSASQPAFSDISGNTNLSQLPVLSNNTVIGNNSGVSAVPSTLTATQVLDMIATTQGDVLYRNATTWVALPPGTSGQVLASGGAAANPSWQTIAGTGTVTNVATGTGLTGGPITTTGTISLASITGGTVLANVTGGSAAPIPNTPSAVLDLIGSAQGDILYRGASTWAVLTPGTSGQVLQTQGPGATPQWANAGSVSSVATGQGLSGGTITTSGTLTTAVGVPTNTLLTKTADYTIANTDCGKTIQAGTGTTGYFKITLPAVAGFGGTCQVTITNNDTARGKALSGFPADVPILVSSSPSIAMLWPLQTVTVGIVNGAWATLQNPGMWLPTATVQMYWDATSGKDDGTTDCLASGSACLTAAHSQGVAAQNINVANRVGVILNVVLASKTLAATENLASGRLVGQLAPSQFIIRGAGIGSCTISSTTASFILFQINNGTMVAFDDCTYTSSGAGGFCIVVVAGYAQAANVSHPLGFNTCKHASMDAAGDSILSVGGNLTFTGTVDYLMITESGAKSFFGGATWTANGTVTCSSFCTQSDINAMQEWTPVPTLSGTFNGVRCNASLGGAINTSGFASSLPGNSACITGSGGNVS